MCFPYVVCTSLGPSAASAGQGRAGLGRFERRKEAGGIRKERMYVWMDVRRYVCIMSHTAR